MSKSGSRYGRRSNWFKIHCLLQEQQQAAAAAAAQGNKKIPSPGSLGMLGHPGSYPQSMYHQRPPCTKEELMLLGLEEYTKLPLPSPAVSSPDSHNSDSSIEINDRRNSISRHQKLAENAQQQMNKDFLMRLPFAGLSGLPFMGQPGAYLPPHHLLLSGYHPALFPHHHDLLKPVAEQAQINPLILSANNNSQFHPVPLSSSSSSSLNSTSAALRSPTPPSQHNSHHHHKRAAEELTKRFYLDAVLKSQRSPLENNDHIKIIDTRSDNDNDDDDDDRHSDKVIAMTPPQSPCIKAVPSPIMASPINTMVTLNTTTTSAARLPSSPRTTNSSSSASAAATVYTINHNNNNSKSNLNNNNNLINIKNHNRISQDIPIDLSLKSESCISEDHSNRSPSRSNSDLLDNEHDELHKTRRRRSSSSFNNNNNNNNNHHSKRERSSSSIDGDDRDDDFGDVDDEEDDNNMCVDENDDDDGDGDESSKSISYSNVRQIKSNCTIPLDLTTKA